jgi:hypothetical protein
VKGTILSVDIDNENENKILKRERNEDDAPVLENKEGDRSAKKIVAFNQYLLLARACCVSFATTADDDFQNKTTQCKEFSHSLSHHRVTIIRARHCTNAGTISSDMSS